MRRIRPALLAFAVVLCCECAWAQVDVSLEQQRLQILKERNAAQTSDSAVINAVLGSHFPPELRGEVDEALAAALGLKDWQVGVQPNAVASFLRRAERPPRDLALLFNAMLAREDSPERVTLLRAARPFGADDEGLTAAVRKEMRSADPVLRVYAAAALTRLAPRDDAGHAVIREYLASDRLADLWRAAEAWGESAGNNEVAARRIDALLKHADVRVRVAAAYNRWRKLKEPEVSVPILVAALELDDEELALDYIYPSRGGRSHRQYVARALGALRGEGADVLKPLVLLAESYAAVDPADHWRLEAAVTALAEIAHSGPVSAETAGRLQRLAETSRFYRRNEAITREVLKGLRIVTP